MTRSIEFSLGEWYHCFARGVDKRRIFESKRDYERFLMLLYASNSDSPVHISNLSRQGVTLMRVLEEERGAPLVSIGAYCLMPNHYHLLLRQESSGGITTFTRKLGTGYTMYFNIKYERSGSLFSGTFKATHVSTDEYLRRVTHYIHANPAELKVPDWKEGKPKTTARLRAFLKSYAYSSLCDYSGTQRIESGLLAKNSLEESLETALDIDTMLNEASDFLHQGDTLMQERALKTKG